MEPKQLGTLEIIWKALEHAGIDPKILSNFDMSLFLGVDLDDYNYLRIYRARKSIWPSIRSTVAYGAASLTT